MRSVYLFVLLSLVFFFTQGADAAELAFEVKAKPQTITIRNLDQALTPTIYIVGRTDISGKNPLYTRGATINGVRLSEKLLTGAIMTLRPDGTGAYGYRPGFEKYTEPREERPEFDIFFNKYKWDPINKVRVIHNNSNLLVVAQGNRPQEAVYEMVVPAPMRIRKVHVRFARAQANPQLQPIIRLFADSQRKKLLGESTSLRHVFEKLDTDKVYLQLTSNGKAQAAQFYNVVFWAELDLGGIKLPSLAKGSNKWTYSDDADSSHQAKIVVSWDGLQPDADPRWPIVPEEMANYTNPIDAKPPPPGKIVSLKEFFALGVYGGVIRQMPPLAYMMDELKKQHGNLWYVNNLDMDYLKELVPLGERRGIRILPQGAGWGSLYYNHHANYTAEQRGEHYKNELVPAAKRIIPKYSNRWGLLGWMLCEEIRPVIVDEISEYYKLARKLDPNHPSLVYHNNLESLRKDIELNGCPIVFYGSYPFFVDARQGPSNFSASLKYFKGRLAKGSALAQEYDLPFWMCLQSVGWPMKFKPEPPHIGWTWGFRNPTEVMMRVQAWLSIAHGVTGFVWFPYATNYPDNQPDGIAPFVYYTTWRKTPVLDYLGRVHKPIVRVAPILLKLKLQKKAPPRISLKGKNLYVGWFKFRKNKYPGYFVVPVNQSESESCEVTFNNIPRGSVVYDLVAGEGGNGKSITLAPGEGRLIYIGPAKYIESLKAERDDSLVEQDTANE